MDYWHKNWTCPFFRWDERLIVGCEGGKFRFPDKQTAVEYMDAYCAGEECAWKSCTVASSLLNHYDRKEEKT